MKRCLQFILVPTVIFSQVLSVAHAQIPANTRFPLQLSWDNAVVFQYVATNNDRAYDTQMIQLLHEKLQYEYAVVILHSLSMLGGKQALASFDSLIATNGDKDLVNYARVARARLVAEDAAKDVADLRAKAKTKIERFYQEMGLSADRINVATRQRATYAYHGPFSCVENIVLMEVADMVYQSGQYEAYMALPEVSQLDFSAQTGAVLKMRVAKVPKSGRIAFLIDEMITEKLADPESSYRVQLLADMGSPLA